MTVYGENTKSWFIPVEGARQNEVVVGANLIQPALVEGPVVDQASRLVYDDEGEDGPGNFPLAQLMFIVQGEGKEWGDTHMVIISFHGSWGK